MICLHAYTLKPAEQGRSSHALVQSSSSEDWFVHHSLGQQRNNPVPRAVFQTNIEENHQNQRDMKSCEVRAGETLLCGAYWDRWRLSVLSG